MSFRVVPSLSASCRNHNQFVSKLRTNRRNVFLKSRRDPIELPAVSSPKDFETIVRCLQNRENVDENLRRLRYIIVKTKGNCIDTLIDLQALSTIVQIIIDQNSSEESVESCLWIFINVTSLSDVYVYHVLSLRILDRILVLIHHKNEGIRTNALWIINNVVLTPKTMSMDDIIQFLLPSLTLCLKTYIQNTDTIEACASVFEQITKIDNVPYQSYFEIIVSFYGLPRYPPEFVNGLTHLIAQKQIRKQIFANEHLLSTFGSLLDAQHSPLAEAILIFFIQVTNLRQKYSQKLLETDTFEFLFNNFKERTRLLRQNHVESLRNYFIIWGNLALLGGNVIRFFDEQRVFIEILAIFQWLVQEDFESLIFFFNNVISLSDDEIKQFLCCEQLFMIYTLFLKEVDNDPQSVVDALCALKTIMIFGDENELEVSNYFVSTGLESIINELSYSSNKNISKMATHILELFEEETNVDMSD